MADSNEILPNLLVIGAQKGGSTWLYHALKQHPDVFMSKVKELSFFDNQEQSVENISKYLGNFSDGADKRYRGEATPGYFRVSENSQNVPQNVIDLIGKDVRLVLSLRDPIDRAVSAYFHHFRAGRMDPSKTMRDQANKGGVLDFGHYKACYETWGQKFPSSSFFFTAFDKIKEDGQKVATELFKWLDLPDHKINRADVRHNAGFEKEIVDGRLQLSFESENPWNKRFWAGELSADPKKGSIGVTQADIDWMAEIFADDIAFVQSNVLSFDVDWGPKPLTFYQ